MQAEKKGFTLVEIIFVVSVIGLLATLGSIAVIRSLNNARISQAETELEVISTAVMQLAWDTGKWPNGAWRNKDASGANELWDLSGTVLMQSPANPDDYPGWKGPYYEGNTKDPFGPENKSKKYFFDSDYQVDGVNRIVVGSFGPNRIGKNVYDDDNVWVAVDYLSPGSSREAKN